MLWSAGGCIHSSNGSGMKAIEPVRLKGQENFYLSTTVQATVPKSETAPPVRARDSRERLRRNSAGEI
jgi:hypothetical protein